MPMLACPRRSLAPWDAPWQKGPAWRGCAWIMEPNLGHPAFLLLPVETDGYNERGEAAPPFVGKDDVRGFYAPTRRTLLTRAQERRAP